MKPSLDLKLRAMMARARMLLQRVSRARRTEKTQQSEFYRNMWSRAADDIGATVVNRHGDLLTIVRNGAVARLFRNNTDLDGPVTLRAAGTKPLVHEALRAHALPTPEYVTYSLDQMHTAFDFLRTHAPCVVKPAAGTGAGAGVTTGIKSRRQFINATIAAAAHCDELLIEQQIAGRTLRLLYLDGKLLDAVERRPPTVVGNGQSTIAQLVQNANAIRLRNGSNAAQVFLRRDLDMQRTLREQGLNWHAVPEHGRVVRVKTVINDNAAADNVSVIHDVSDEIVAAGRLAAEAFAVRLAGVDVVTPDMTAGLDSSGGVILEINTVPGLYIHEARQPLCVAVPILEACLRLSRSEQRPEAVSSYLSTAAGGT